jgi:hypothetical protein
MFQFIGKRMVTRPKVCEEGMDVEPLFPGLGSIGNLLGSVSLITLLFLLMAFLYVEAEVVVQPYYASNCHPCFFWLGIKKFICTAILRVGEWRCSSTHASPRLWLQVFGHLHA